MTKAELEQYRSIAAELKELEKIDFIDIDALEYMARETLRQQKAVIDKFINNIKDVELKRIFKERYIKGKYRPSFQAIAIKMGYSDEGTPRKKIKKYLELSENSEFKML